MSSENVLFFRLSSGRVWVIKWNEKDDDVLNTLFPLLTFYFKVVRWDWCSKIPPHIKKKKNKLNNLCMYVSIYLSISFHSDVVSKHFLSPTSESTKPWKYFPWVKCSSSFFLFVCFFVGFFCCFLFRINVGSYKNFDIDTRNSCILSAMFSAKNNFILH